VESRFKVGRTTGDERLDLRPMAGFGMEYTFVDTLLDAYPGRIEDTRW
jgi:hypothetical protein